MFLQLYPKINIYYKTKEMTKQQKVRKSKNAVFLMHVHLVFVTKYRKKVFDSRHLKYIEELTLHICKQKQCTLKEFNGEKDHIHILIEYPPKLAVTELINLIKGSSSRRLKQNFPSRKYKFPKGALWSHSYFAGSVGGATLDVVKKYIENQDRPN